MNKENLDDTNISNNKNYIKWSSQQSNNEHQTYAGYLRKRGALFKQWNERYFVLDSIKHQVNFFELIVF
jgi:myotubularin-related protein 5/13